MSDKVSASEVITLATALAELGAQALKSRGGNPDNLAEVRTEISRLQAEHEGWDAPVPPSKKKGNGDGDVVVEGENGDD